MAIDRDGDGPPLRKDDERAPKPAEGLRASPFTEDVFDDEYYGRRRRGGGISFGVIAGVVFVAAMVAAAGWYIVGERSGSTGGAGGADQIVKADPTPYKMKPDDPGGMQVDNQDKMIYDRVAKGAPPSRVENLLPAPEEPHAPPAQAAPAASVTGPVQSAAPAASTPAASSDDPLAKLMAQIKGLGSSQPAPSPPPAAATAQPPPVPSVATPDKSAPEALAVAPAAAPSAAPVQMAASPPAAEATAPSEPEAKPTVAAPAAAQPSVAPASPMLLVPAADSTAPPPPAVVPAPDATVAQAQAPAPVVAPSATPSQPATGSMSIQLASARSEDAAMGEWKRINGKNSDLLTGLTPTVVQAEVPDKGTYFRLRAGPVADKPAAQALCEALAARNVSCIVVRP